MKKVLFVSPSSKFSGAEISLLDVIEVLKDNYEISLITSGKGKFHDKVKKRFPVYTFDLTDFRRNQGPGTTLLYLLNIIRNSIKIAGLVRREKISIVYFNGIKAALYAPGIRLFSGKKMVWHIRDMLPGKILSRLLLFFSDRVICNSQFIYKQLPSSEKKALIYNGIDIHKFSPRHSGKKLLQAELPFLLSRLVVAQIGQLEQWKNHHLFIDVARRIISRREDVHFVIFSSDMGSAFPEYRQQLQELIRAAALESNFSILDFKDPITGYLNEIDILLHLACNEPFGRVLIEAMAMAKPVLAIKSGGPAEIVQDGKTGYLADSLSADVIADKLEVLMDNEALRERFGQAGRKRVQERFNIHNLMEIGEILSRL